MARDQRPVEWNCREEDSNDVVIVAVGQDSGRLYLFCVDCAYGAMADGGKAYYDAYGEGVAGTPESVVWQGTHSLGG